MWESGHEPAAPKPDVVAAIQAAKDRLQSEGRADPRGLPDEQMTITDLLGEPDEA